MLEEKNPLVCLDWGNSTGDARPQRLENAGFKRQGGRG